MENLQIKGNYKNITTGTIVEVIDIFESEGLKKLVVKYYNTQKLEEFVKLADVFLKTYKKID